jgi:hypothetical protein
MYIATKNIKTVIANIGAKKIAKITQYDNVGSIVNLVIKAIIPKIIKAIMGFKPFIYTSYFKSYNIPIPIK